MKFKSPIKLESIAQLINATLIGNDGEALGINEIHKVEVGDLVFVDHPKYYDTCLNSAASFIIINKEVEVPEGKAILVTEKPFDAYCKIVETYAPFKKATSTINTNAIGEGTYIYPGAFIGNNVSVGKDCIIFPNATIMDNCVLGNNVIVQSGTVIGGDAFYYNTKKDREVWYKKMPSCGRVILEDNVEIGAGCMIDRGVTHDTIIGKGTKLDNMIHVGHDTVIGKNCLLAAATTIAGMVTIKDGVTIWGGCIINKTLTIGENAVLLGRTGVGGDLEGNKTYWGAPAQDAGIVKREMIWIKRIPQLWDKVMGKPESNSTKE
jgi:UDP-3-O-[3-hydroxymyristoyl] glucosamine N-acyltransferase